MYDALTTRYTFACPVHGTARVRLSRFRRLEQLPGRTTRPSTGLSSRVGAAPSTPAS